MKPTPIPRAVQARRLARDALETYAAEKLDLNTIVAETTKMAGLGLCTLTLNFDRPLDLRDTKAATALAATLKAECYTLEWRERNVFPGDAPNRTATTTFDLLLRW